MKVKDLIGKLKQFNEDREVLIQSRYASYHFHIDKVIRKGKGKKKAVFIWEGKQVWFSKDDENEDI